MCSRHEERHLVAEREEALDRALQLSHVPRPVVRLEPLEEFVREEALASKLRPELAGEERNVLAPAPERRELDPRAGEAVVEIPHGTFAPRRACRGRARSTTMTRASTFTGCVSPRRTMTPLSSARRSFACTSRSRSPGSSMKSVPPFGELEDARRASSRRRGARRTGAPRRGPAASFGSRGRRTAPARAG